MIIDYTEHANFRMRHRKISRAEVEDAIRNSDFSFVTGFGRLAALKKSLTMPDIPLSCVNLMKILRGKL